MYQTKNMGLNITEMPKDSLNAFSFHTDLGHNFEAIDNLALSHRNITNCLLEVPQDIKLELADGVLTLKEGSKVYFPNGINIFEEIITNSNVSISNFDNITNSVILFYNANTNTISWHILGQNIYSGETEPTSLLGQSIWFDTANNSIKYVSGANNSWTITALTLPFAIVTIINGVPVAIDQVFNGYGYIGSTLFELPGVKGLIVEGVNDDGTLRTVIKTTTSVAIDSTVGVHSNSVISNLMGTIEDTVWLGESDKYPSTEGVLATPRYLNTITNFIQIYYGDSNSWGNQYGFLQVFEDLQLDPTGKILSMTPKKPFRAVDHNDYSTKITELEAKIEALQTAVKALQG